MSLANSSTEGSLIMSQKVDKFPLDESILEHLRELEARPLDVRELVIENDNPVWTWLLRYGSLIREKDAGTQYERADRIATLSKADGRLEVGLATGRHCLTWRNHTFEVVIVEHDGSKESARIHLKDVETCAAFEDFLRYGRERSKRKGGSDTDKVVVRVIHNSKWLQVSTYPKRVPESIVTGDSTVNDLLLDMHKFIASEEDYIKYGRPFKRNVLIVGQAGSGKSSIITIMASELDLDICFISITPTMDEKNLCTAIGNLTNNSMLVIEDVDILCTTATTSTGAQNALSVLTNVLDGTLHKHKLITVLTTTSPDALEGVLVRKGRIDYTCRLSPLNKTQVESMVKRVYHDIEGVESLTKLIWKQIESLKGVTATVLADFLFRHRNDKPDDLDIAELAQGTHTEHILDGRKSIPDHFYM